MNVQGASKCLGQSDMFAMQSRFHNLREGNYRYSEYYISVIVNGKYENIQDSQGKIRTSSFQLLA